MKKNLAKHILNLKGNLEPYGNILVYDGSSWEETKNWSETMGSGRISFSYGQISILIQTWHKKLDFIMPTLIRITAVEFGESIDIDFTKLTSDPPADNGFIWSESQEAFNVSFKYETDTSLYKDAYTKSIAVFFNKYVKYYEKVSFKLEFFNYQDVLKDGCTVKPFTISGTYKYNINDDRTQYIPTDTSKIKLIRVNSTYGITTIEINEDLINRRLPFFLKKGFYWRYGLPKGDGDNFSIKISGDGLNLSFTASDHIDQITITNKDITSKFYKLMQTKDTVTLKIEIMYIPPSYL